jgi:hypothetical protein
VVPVHGTNSGPTPAVSHVWLGSFVLPRGIPRPRSISAATELYLAGEDGCIREHNPLPRYRVFSPTFITPHISAAVLISKRETSSNICALQHTLPASLQKNVIIDLLVPKQGSLHCGAVNTQCRCYTFCTHTVLSPHARARIHQLLLGQNRSSSASVSSCFLSLAPTCDGTR